MEIFGFLFCILLCICIFWIAYYITKIYEVMLDQDRILSRIVNSLEHREPCSKQEPPLHSIESDIQ